MLRPRLLLPYAVVLRLAAEPFQSQELTFKIEVPTVTVDVIATDRKGHHVPGLTRERFKVFEDNVPQEIVSFIPAGTAGAPAPAPAGHLPVGQPRVIGDSSPHAEPARKPQSITLLLDLGDLQFQNLKNACHAASQYVQKTVDGGNQVALYWVDTGLHLAVPFTTDKQRLLDAIEKLSQHVPDGRFIVRDRMRTQARIDDLFTTLHPETLYGGAPRPKPIDPLLQGVEQEMNTLRSWLVIENTFQARAVFVALRAMAVAYRGLPGRKSVVVFSEGFLHSPEAGPELQAVIDAGNRAGVAFYVIDASGVAGSLIDSEVREPDIGGRRSHPDMLVDNFQPVMGQDRFDWNATLPSDVHSDLGLIAQATGGFLVTNTNDLLRAVERVESDGAEAYTLVYHPTNRLYNGAFRNIKVALDNGSYVLRYRQGYWAIPPGREVMMTPSAAQLLNALETGSRKPTFAPEINAALVASRDGRFAIPVAVSMPGSLTTFDKSKDRFVTGVTMLLLARNAEGKLVSLHERYSQLSFSAKERDEFRRKVFNLQGHVPVQEFEPLTVQAIVQFSTGAVGMSAPVSLNTDGRLSHPRLTTMVLSNRVENAECDADTTDPLCLGDLRVYLPAHPRFAASEKLVAYFTALDLGVDPQTKLPALAVTFALQNGANSRQIPPKRIQAVPGTAANSLRVLAEFDLTVLAPGTYALHADAEDTVRHSRSTGGAVFTVE